MVNHSWKTEGERDQTNMSCVHSAESSQRARRGLLFSISFSVVFSLCFPLLHLSSFLLFYGSYIYCPPRRRPRRQCQTQVLRGKAGFSRPRRQKEADNRAKERAPRPSPGRSRSGGIGAGVWASVGKRRCCVPLGLACHRCIANLSRAVARRCLHLARRSSLSS